VSTEHVQALVFVFQLKSGICFGTILAHTLSMFTFVVKVCLTISLSIFNSSAVILMPKWSVLTRSLHLFHISSVFIITGKIGHSSSSMSCLSSENLLCHSDIWAVDMVLFSPYTSHNILNVSVPVVFSFTRNLMLIHCSIFYQA